MGLYPDENKPDVAYEDITEDMTVCDVVFNPPETKFLKEAKAHGAATVNGLGMLVNQAALNYCLWTENMAPKDVMKEALLREFGLENEVSKEYITIQENVVGNTRQNIEANAERTTTTDIAEHEAGENNIRQIIEKNIKANTGKNIKIDAVNAIKKLH